MGTECSLRCRGGAGCRGSSTARHAAAAHGGAPQGAAHAAVGGLAERLRAVLAVQQQRRRRRAPLAALRGGGPPVPPRWERAGRADGSGRRPRARDLHLAESRSSQRGIVARRQRARRQLLVRALPGGPRVPARQRRRAAAQHGGRRPREEVARECTSVTAAAGAGSAHRPGVPLLGRARARLRPARERPCDWLARAARGGPAADRRRRPQAVRGQGRGGDPRLPRRQVLRRGWVRRRFPTVGSRVLGTQARGTVRRAPGRGKAASAGPGAARDRDRLAHDVAECRGSARMRRSLVLHRRHVLVAAPVRMAA